MNGYINIRSFTAALHELVVILRHISGTCENTVTLQVLLSVPSVLSRLVFELSNDTGTAQNFLRKQDTLLTVLYWPNMLFIRL